MKTLLTFLLSLLISGSCWAQSGPAQKNNGENKDEAATIQKNENPLPLEKGIIVNHNRRVELPIIPLAAKEISKDEALRNTQVNKEEEKANENIKILNPK